MSSSTSCALGRTRAPLLALALGLAGIVSGCETMERQGFVASGSTRPADDHGKHRPFGRFAVLQSPTASGQEPGAAVYGSGSFVGQPGATRTRLPTDDPDGRAYTLNLSNATIQEAAQAVLGDIFGVPYTVDTRIDARLVLQTPMPVPRSGVAELFESSLRSVGAAVVQTGGHYRIVAADRAAAGSRIESGASAGPVGSRTRVVKLKYVTPDDLAQVLEPLATFGGIVRADAGRNALVLTGTEQELDALEEAVSVFDVDAMRGMSFALVPVKAVDPEAIVPDLTTIFRANAEGTGMVQFVPNKRLGSMLVVSRNPRYLAEAQQWVRRLERQAAGVEQQLFSYALRNRQASEIVEIVHAMFASETRPSEAPDAAPRFRTAEAGELGASAFAAGAVGQAAATLGGLGRTPQAIEATSFGERRGTPGPRIKIVADDAQNTLLVMATRADYERIARVVANLDVVPNQVLIEATIAEVTLSDDLNLGVRWFLQNKTGSSTGMFSNALDGALGSVFPGFSYVLKNLNVQVVLNALNAVADVNVLASPSLMVLDKKTASLQIGDQVPIITQSAASVLTPGAPIVNSIAYRDTGVILRVTPRINEAGRVLLDIEQEVSSVQPTSSSTINSPTISQRRLKTTVVVNTGESITLGGIIQDRTSVRSTQVPILGNIPIVGNAFRHKENAVQRTELILMLTPKVVRDLNEAQAVTDEFRHKMRALSAVPNGPADRIRRDVRRIVE